MKFSPDPKKKRERLKRNSVAWRNRVSELYERENGICQLTGKWLDRCEASPHHTIPVGSGGGDDLSNLMLLSQEAHMKVHSGELKLK